jgi:hypothetical protein
MWESRCSRPSRNKDLVQLTKYGVRVYHESHASGVFRDVGERLPGPWLSRLSDSVASKGPARPSAVDSRATLSPDCHGCVTVCVARIGLLTNLRLRQASLAWWQQCLSVCEGAQPCQPSSRSRDDAAERGERKDVDTHVAY